MKFISKNKPAPKVLSFPKSKHTRPRWLINMRNLRKGYFINLALSGISMVATLALVVYIIFKINNGV